ARRYRYENGRLHSETYGREGLAGSTPRVGEVPQSTLEEAVKDRLSKAFFAKDQPVGPREIGSLNELVERARPYPWTFRDVRYPVMALLDRAPTTDQIKRSTESATVFAKNVTSVLVDKGFQDADDRPWEYVATDDAGKSMRVQINGTAAGERTPSVVISLDQLVRANGTTTEDAPSLTLHETIEFRVDRGLFVGEESSHYTNPDGSLHSLQPKRQAILEGNVCHMLHHFIHDPHLSAREL
ncbi:MAG TPA: hypothetical protein VF809_00365, partial [Candidatus Saccharimonadales bacterium]